MRMSTENKNIEYTSLDKTHKEILENLSKVCRTDKDGHFSNEDRLDAIREELKNTKYKEYKTDSYSLWSKVPPEELNTGAILVSSHIDTVSSIGKCYSELSEDGWYKGTYDNMITNAASVILMKECEDTIPDNIVFAFTGDEETGRCTGAKEVSEYLYSLGKMPLCIALDVTYEGFDENVLMSVENVTAPKEIRDSFLNQVVDYMLKTEMQKSFCFTKAGKKYVPTNIPKGYMTNSTGMYDEAFAYRDMGFPGMSLCIPTHGNMHGESGLYVKQPVFEGYIISLESFLYSLTKTHDQLIEANKIAKDHLIGIANDIEFKKAKNSYLYSDNIYSTSGSNYYSGDSFLINFGNKNDISEYVSQNELLEEFASLCAENALYWRADDFYDFYDNMELSPEHASLFFKDVDTPTDIETSFYEQYLYTIFEQSQELLRTCVQKYSKLKSEVYEQEDYDQDDDYHEYMCKYNDDMDTYDDSYGAYY